MGEETFTGYIYKISSPHTDKVYIGSTIQTLKQRLKEHIVDYKLYITGKYHFVTSFDIIKLDDFSIDEMEKLVNITKNELYFREAYLIKNTANVINKVIPILTQEEKLEYKKNYYLINKQTLSIKRKEKLEKCCKVKQNCICGGSCLISNKLQHNKSQKHLAYIASLAHTIINIQNLTINNK